MTHPLNVKVLALSFGFLWAISVLAIGLLSMLFDYGTAWLQLLAAVYPGYAPTVTGILLGTVWGFIDGAIGGALFGWIYNAVARRFA